MFAAISHNVLVSNYVPFFDLESSSIEYLDAEFTRLGGRYVQGFGSRDYGSLLWIVTAPKRMHELEDDTTYVSHERANVLLVGYPGTPPKETFVKCLSDLQALDTYVKSIEAVYLFSVSLDRSNLDGFTYCVHPDLVSAGEPVRDLWSEEGL